MKTDESGLIEKLRLGDEKAFRILFDLYKINVYNTASGFLTNVNDAEDVTQEVFIQVFKSIEHLDRKSVV